MVQELTVECPHCHQVADIFLTTNACVIILNCPCCSSPIMYFDEKIFILTPQQLETIKKRSHSASAMNMLKNLVKSEQLPVKNQVLQRNEELVQEQLGKSILSRLTPPSNSDAKIHIGDDDITNLKIELGRCTSVEDFLMRV